MSELLFFWSKIWQKLLFFWPDFGGFDGETSRGASRGLFIDHHLQAQSSWSHVRNHLSTCRSGNSLRVFINRTWHGRDGFVHSTLIYPSIPFGDTLLYSSARSGLRRYVLPRKTRLLRRGARDKSEPPSAPQHVSVFLICHFSRRRNQRGGLHFQRRR